MRNDAELLVEKGPAPGERFPLDERVLGLGRDPRNAIVINHPEVSRRHARFVRRGGAWVVEDLDSTNGTFVNGTALVGPHALEPGDVVRLSDAVLLRFRQEEPPPKDVERPRSAPAAQPTPPPALDGIAARRDEPVERDRRPAPPSLRGSGLPDTGDRKEGWQDRTWLWIGAGFVVLLVIAACAALLILGYLGVLPALFSQSLHGLGLA